MAATARLPDVQRLYRHLAVQWKKLAYYQTDNAVEKQHVRFRDQQ
jgi:hypothetical protein